MGYYVERLNRPYDFRVLIEAYVYTKRTDFVHPDFGTYYAGLLEHLEKLFDIRLSGEQLTFDQRVFWGLFNSTVSSLLCITSPWDAYLEAGLTHRKLEECGEPGKVVEQASAAIGDANRESQIAHRDMLHALFVAIFGERSRVVTSEELLRAGFDDSKEPDITNYYDYF